MNSSNFRKILFVARVAGSKLRVHPRDFLLSIRIAFWVALISVLARLTSLPRAQRIVSFRLSSTAVQTPLTTPAKLGQVVDSLLRIDLFMFRPNCWKRAIVLHRFLSLNGIESRINFGLRKELDGKVSGHAWLEHDGQALLEKESGSYIVTFSLPAKSSVFLSASS
ncbi:MAG: lasso peptide biosynthesis B2 protein [Acidobacteriota bacterium]